MKCYLCNTEIFSWEEQGFTSDKEEKPYHQECQDDPTMEAEVSNK